MVLVLSLAAFVGATISGITGIGGGTLLIAVMFAVGLSPAVAVPLHAAVQLVSNASRALAYRKHIHYPAVAWFFLACLPLPFLTASLVVGANVDVIRLVLAAFIFLSLLPTPPSLAGRFHSIPGRMLAAGVLNGSIGMWVGATGLAIGPFFLHEQWKKETTVGTLALCQSLGHALKIVAFAGIGFGLVEHFELLWPLALAVIGGTFLGRYLMRYLSAAAFKKLFKSILFVLALRLAWTGATGLWA